MIVTGDEVGEVEVCLRGGGEHQLGDWAVACRRTEAGGEVEEMGDGDKEIGE